MIKIYGKSNCPYCDKAKALAEDKGVCYSYIDLSQDTEALLEFKTKGFRTVPIIYDGDEYIGGYTELYKLLT